MRKLATLAVLLSAAIVAGCSGGGSTVSTSTLPSAKAPVVAPSGNAKITMTIKRLIAPTVSNQSAGRSARTISQTAHGLKLEALGATGTAAYTTVYDLTATSTTQAIAACQIPIGIYTTCSVDFTPPLSTTAVRVSVCPDISCASGTLLSSGTVALTSSNFVKGMANAISVTLTGIATKMSIAAADPAPAGNKSIPIAVQLYDASGSVILGPDAYAGDVTLTSSDPAQTLTLTAVPNLDQQTAIGAAQNQGSATPTPIPQPSSSPSVSVTFNARFLQPVLAFTGTSTTPAFMLSASYSPAGGTPLTATLPITPMSINNHNTPGGSTLISVTGTTQVYSVRQDSAGNAYALAAFGSGKNAGFVALAPSTYATGTAYPITFSNVMTNTPGTVRNIGRAITGPDNNLWFTYCVRSVSTGACTSDAGFAKFDIMTHLYTEYPSKSGTTVGELVSTGSSLVAATTGSTVTPSIEVLPFSSGVPGTMNEVPFAPIAGTTSTTNPLTVPAPEAIVQIGTSTYVVENDHAGLPLTSGVSPTYIAQIDAAGNKIANTETVVNPAAPGLQLVFIASSATAIYFTDTAYDGQVFSYDPSSKVTTSFSIPNLSRTQAFGRDQFVIDGVGNFWFVQFDVNGGSRQVIMRDPLGTFNQANTSSLNFYNRLTTNGTQVFMSGYSSNGGGFYLLSACNNGC